MSKCRDRTRPNTRRKLHRLRADRRRVQLAAAKLERLEQKQQAREARPFDEALKGCADV